MTNVAVFVDVQNIYYTTRDGFNRRFDYNAFWQQVSSKYNIASASAYAIASNNEKQRQFHHILRGVGFEVKLKPYIQRADGSAKGDWDVGITLDIIEAAINPDIDEIILLSGDGDFDLLAERVISKYKKLFTVYSVESLTAQSLKTQASYYHPIEDNLLL